VKIPAVVSIHNIKLARGRTIQIGNAVLRKPIRYDKFRLVALLISQVLVGNEPSQTHCRPRCAGQTGSSPFTEIAPRTPPGSGRNFGTYSEQAPAPARRAPRTAA
jgi:hypothetical protein